jgi:hypothetical protein
MLGRSLDELDELDKSEARSQLETKKTKRIAWQDITLHEVDMYSDQKLSDSITLARIALKRLHPLRHNGVAALPPRKRPKATRQLHHLRFGHQWRQIFYVPSINSST